MSGASAIQVQAITKSFGSTRVLGGVDLEVSGGEIIALLGPSGCGKTTLLRLLAGLERPDEGRVALDGAVVAEGGTFVAPERRGVGLVFQDYALFPQRTVGDNVAFGLRRLPKSERPARVAAVLERVDMTGYGDRYPHELSGGQQQRVALARALAPKPGVLLLDEPFSNLDAGLRRRLRMQLGALLRDLGITTVFVTHDQDEALGLADRVAVMVGGVIAQVGPPGEVYERPMSEAVARVVGEVNLIAGSARGGTVTTALGTFQGAGPEGAVEVLFRPEHLGVCAPGEEGARAIVSAREYLGREAHLLVDCGESRDLAVRCEAAAEIAAGDTIAVCSRTSSPLVWFAAGRVE